MDKTLSTSFKSQERWQSGRMHRIRNPAYRFSCTEGSNPSLSADNQLIQFNQSQNYFADSHGWHCLPNWRNIARESRTTLEENKPQQTKKV
jgi:hypothetical protein